jgi:dipeptidyl-peptidase-4
MRIHVVCLSCLAWTMAPQLAPGRNPQHVKDAPLDTSYLRTHAETRGFMLGRPVQARPTPDGKAVLFLRAQARVPTLRLYEFDVATRRTRALLTPEQVLKGAEEKLSPEEKARRERMRVSVGGFTQFQLSDDGALILVSLSGKLYTLRRADGRVEALHAGPGVLLDPRFAPDGKSVAYVRDHDLYVYDLAGRKEHRLTAGGSERLTHGLAEFVAQEEMSRFSGYWWSPDSRSLAYEEADAAGVETWYVADPARPELPPHPSFYPRPGKANVKVRLGVVPAAGGDTVWLRWDARRYPYLTSVHWGKRGPLTVCVQTRDQKELLLLKADPATGKTRVLATETDPAWVNVRQDVPRWLAGGKSFLWVSERAGGPELEWRDANGKLRRVLVGRAAGLQGLLDVDPAGQVFYRASPDPTQAVVYSLSLEKGKPVPLSTGGGVHSAAFSKNHATVVEQAMLPDAMPRTTVRLAGGRRADELPSVAEDPPFVPRAELLKVGKGPGFHAAVVRPRDFDGKRRYPVIVDVYGGPQHSQVLAVMGTRLLDQWLADQGFIVVSIDGRGTPGRGRDWERAIAGRFGSVPLEDQVAGLRALGRRFPEMDLDRVGIVGWSFGGYLSALAVLRRPDVYKAAVAGAPVTDWFDYDTHYTERYLGVPDAGAAAYKEASLLTYAADLRRPLLLIHGTADDNVYFRHTLKLANALFRAGKDFELLPLPGLTHMVPDPVVTERLWSRIVKHFHEHLGQPVDRPRPHPAASAR